MSEIAINTAGVSQLAGGTQATDAAASLPKAPQKPDAASTRATTGYSATPAIPQTDSKLVARMIALGAVPYVVNGRTVTGLAQIPPSAEPQAKQASKKPAGPMTAARSLDGGRSPLAPTSLFDARASIDTLGAVPAVLGQDASEYWNSRIDSLDAFLGGAG